MTSNTTVTAIYSTVIDDVINNVRGDFEDMGVDESILMELKRSWANKLRGFRLGGSAENPEVPSPPLHTSAYGDYYDERAVGGRYETHNTGDATYAAHNAAANLASLAQSSSSASYPTGAGNARMYTQPDCRQATSSGGTGRIPQTDGPADAIPSQNAAKMSTKEIDDLLHAELTQTASPELTNPNLSSTTPPRTRLRQVDGDDDEEDEEDINSDLDDTDEEDREAEGTDNTAHIVLCQYEKVTRTKNKWKCVLKDGIMLINGQDYLFHKANGDFEW